MTGFLLNNYMRWLLLLLLSSCQTAKLTPEHTSINRTVEFQQEIDELIARDADNKHWARVYLHEIDQAMLNDDMPAYVFFVGEFEKIPLEIVPEEHRDEPGYVAGPSALELHFRLRWFEQAVLLYKQHSQNDK
jgi:hypothetical protein